MLYVFLALGVVIAYRWVRHDGGAVVGTISPSTSQTIASDLSELPRDVRDYVMSFVVDPASQPDDFEEGAAALRERFPRAAARLGAIAAEKRAGRGGAIVSAGLSARTMMTARSTNGVVAGVFGMRTCETSLMTSSWTCCQCRHSFRNSINSCPNCDHRRCG